jgi:hypothetical protein
LYTTQQFETSESFFRHFNINERKLWVIYIGNVGSFCLCTDYVRKKILNLKSSSQLVSLQGSAVCSNLPIEYWDK